jgi:hypothetical protein
MNITNRLFLSLAATVPFFLLLCHATPIGNRFSSKKVSHQRPRILHDRRPFIDPVYFSQAAFCDPQVGDIVRGAKVYWRTGDGGDLPTTFMAYSKEKGIIISSQGTNGSDHSSIMNVCAKETVEEMMPLLLIRSPSPQSTRTCN